MEDAQRSDNSMQSRNVRRWYVDTQWLVCSVTTWDQCRNLKNPSESNVLVFRNPLMTSIFVHCPGLLALVLSCLRVKRKFLSFLEVFPAFTTLEGISTGLWSSFALHLFSWSGWPGWWFTEEGEGDQWEIMGNPTSKRHEIETPLLHFSWELDVGLGPLGSCLAMSDICSWSCHV